MTTLESALAGIEQMTSKATEGPWKQTFHGDHHTTIDAKDGAIGILDSEPSLWDTGEFIAASRMLVPALLRALRTAVEQRNDAMSSTGLIHFDGKEDADSRLAAILANGREGR